MRWPARTTTIVGASLAWVLAASAALSAHDVGVTSIARLFIDQIGETRYQVVAGVDTGTPPIDDVPGVLPAGCHRIAGETAGSQVSSEFAFECEQELTFDDVINLPWKLAGAVVVARWRDGTNASAYFAGSGGVVPVRLAELRTGSSSFWRLAQRYFVLGVGHILSGVDHLLFVVGLFLLAHGVRRLIKTITAFTVAHSLTLGAAVLGLIPVNPGPVEASIALSIVLLAREIVSARSGAVHLVHRKPWLVAFAFGLLHGFGFAGALGDIGLRSSDIPVALLFFNCGVEAGQLAFVGVLLIGTAFAARIRTAWFSWAEAAVGYGLGALATLWFFGRLPGVWGP